MYVVKIFINRNLRGVAHFNSYEHALSAIIDKDSEMYSYGNEISDYFEKNNIDLSRPKIICPSNDNTGFGVDLEFCYYGESDKMVVSIEEPLIEDERGKI